MALEVKDIYTATCEKNMNIPKDQNHRLILPFDPSNVLNNNIDLSRTCSNNLFKYVSEFRN